MSDVRLVAQPALAEFVFSERFGNPAGPAGVTVVLRHDLRIASVIARRGCEAELAVRVERTFEVAPPPGPHRIRKGNLTILGIGPGRWMFLQEKGAPEFADVLARDLKGLASISDHSDGYAVFEVGGPLARQALAKGVAIDLHPKSFGVADAAVTSIAHIGAMLWQTDDAPRYAIAVFRSSAGSFWHGLRDSAAEFGLTVHPG
ncbi:MAG TPA: sarcosine oxidase subunit gamma family protein [Micropepsaceae bacterium]|nr:sarcosine oxidase subunit gamma family protein [Micropepsaceae bacterium]